MEKELSIDIFKTKAKSVGLLLSHYGFWYAMPKTRYYSKLMEMQSKLVRAKVEWNTHITLTWSNEDINALKQISAIGETGLSVTQGTKVMQAVRALLIGRGYKSWADKLKWFVKYEEGGHTDHPHLHVLTTWKQHKGLMYHIVKRKWKAMGFGGIDPRNDERFVIVDISPIKNTYHLNSIVNNEYYVLKSYAVTDMLKPSGMKHLKKGGHFYSFGGSIKFEPKSPKPKRHVEWATPWRARKMIDKTYDTMMDYYAVKGLDGQRYYDAQVKLIEDAKRG